MYLIFCTKNTALPALRSAGKSRVCVQIHLRNVICTYLQHFSFAETETAKEQGGILCTLLPRDNIPFSLTIRFPVTESNSHAAVWSGQLYRKLISHTKQVS